MKNFSRKRLFSVLLIFFLGLNSAQARTMDRQPQEKEIIVKSDQNSSQKNKEFIKFFDKNGYLLENNTFLSLKPFFGVPKSRNQIKIKVTLTAYSSSFGECDGNPFRTASGSRVRDGVVAANFLPFGSKIKIPQFFGNKIFVVEDRMSRKFWFRVDIWMSDYQTAIKFGRKYAEIEILDY